MIILMHYNKIFLSSTMKYFYWHHSCLASSVSRVSTADLMMPSAEVAASDIILSIWALYFS